jgi:Protein of unknown function (DUF3365)
MSRTIVACIGGALIAFTVARADAQAPRDWPTYPISEAPADLRPAVQRGDMAIISIQNAVLSELTRELTERGAGGAIQVCHMAATTIVNRLGREEGIAAGRTSARLRTPSNAPKPWAAAIVARYADRRAAGVDGFAVDLGERVGVMRPIAHRAVCSPCHGAEEQLSPKVRAELRDRYPRDRAVGFKDGDLRGWLWVEVPKK